MEDGAVYNTYRRYPPLPYAPLLEFVPKRDIRNLRACLGEAGIRQ